MALLCTYLRNRAMIRAECFWDGVGFDRLGCIWEDMGNEHTAREWNDSPLAGWHIGIARRFSMLAFLLLSSLSTFATCAAEVDHYFKGHGADQQTRKYQRQPASQARSSVYKAPQPSAQHPVVYNSTPHPQWSSGYDFRLSFTPTKRGRPGFDSLLRSISGY